MAAGEADETTAASGDPTAATVPSSASADSAGPVPGTRWARYLVLELLGEGGMGSVHAARDTELDREVALKVLHDELLARASQERLRREARAMARVSHPNVVPVFDVGEHQGRTYYTMERIRGQSVKEWLHEPRAWPEVQRVFLDAARGLAAIHAAGIVHRDVKPGNLLLGDDGRTRVADLGIALGDPAVPGGAPLGATTTLHNAGTPAYMAPEQLRGEAGDARADQFAFGVALFEALHGRRPFVGASLAELTEAMTAAPVGIRDVPGWLAEVVQRALAVDPDARFADMAALIRALEGPRPRPRRWPWLVVAAVGIAGAAALIVLVTRRPDAAPAPAAPAPQPGMPDLAHARALTSVGGDCAQGPTFADAETVVFEIQAGDAMDLYRVPLAGGDALPLATSAAWDWHPGPGRRPGEIVHLVSPPWLTTPGGSSVEYLDVASGVAITAATVVALDAALAGETIYYTAAKGSELRRLRGGQDELVYKPPSKNGAVTLSVSPTKDRIAYAGMEADGRVAVCVLTLDAPPATCFAGDIIGGPRPAFAADGSAIYYPTSKGIARRDLATHAETIVIGGVLASGGLAIAPGGTALVYSTCGLDIDLFDVTGSPPSRIVDNMLVVESSFGPAGALAWTESQYETNVLHVRLPDGHRLQLTDVALGSVAGPAFSTTGQQLAFSVLTGPTAGLYVMRAEDGALPSRLTSREGDRTPAWTPDGKIAFARKDDDKVQRTYLLDPDTKAIAPLGATAHIVVGVDPQTGWILLAGRGKMIWHDPATGHEQPGPSGLPADAGYPSLSPSGKWLVFHAGAKGAEIWRMSLDPVGQPERVFVAPIKVENAAIHDDGRVAVAVQSWSGDLHMVPSASGSRF